MGGGCGADAVYLAGKAYGMRAKCGNFSDQELTEAVKFCHENGVKVYVTANVLARTGKIGRCPVFLACARTSAWMRLFWEIRVFEAAN